MKLLRILSLLSCLITFAAADYAVRDLPVPEGTLIEAGGVCHWPDGSLVVATRRGDVWTLSDGQWNRFATGLMDPLGIWADQTGEVYVTQSGELTRIRDLDGDLTADRYETLTSGWGVPGSKTDFVYGLCRDAEGNFYGTMHTTHAPWAGGVRHSPHSFGGPMGAAMIGRGWSFQVNPQGELTWWSSGLRAPNGLGFNAKGDLFATDNQGDWVGTSALHHIEQGDFHGHPSSYQWDPRRTLDLNLPLEQLAVELDRLRKRPAVLFPHGILGNSPSQPVLAPADGRFGPFAGQMFVGDNVAPLISRVFLEQVDGGYQGVCFPFLRERGLQKALCRMTFSPEGNLVIGYGCRGWGPATDGLQEVVWSGETPFEMQHIRLLADGFEIRFTKPLGEVDLARACSIQSYSYKYHHLYGSPITDPRPAVIQQIQVSADRKTARLQLSSLEAGRIYEFKLNQVIAADESFLTNNEAYYTLNRLQPALTFFPFCMDQGTLVEQAALFRELGYPGAGHLCQDLGYEGLGEPNTTVEQRAKSLDDQGLRLVQAFTMAYLEQEVPLNLQRIEEMMPTLSAHGSQLIVRLMGNREVDLDGKAVALLGRMADIAKPHGVTIAIYPHIDDYTENSAEALRVVRKLNRPEEVGLMFTFCHWQTCDPNRDLRAVLTAAAPNLKAISINGSNTDKPAVLPLSEGDFDNGELLEILRDIKYQGPVGLMCWGIRGSARDHLAASKMKWKALNPTPALVMKRNGCDFETGELRGRIGDGRFIGVNQLVHKPTGTKISGDGIANRHGLLSLYRVFTRNHRHGEAAYDWPEREISSADDSVLMRWPATETRPFELSARYSFPRSNQIRLQVSVTARAELSDFEVQVASYFDPSFPNAGVLSKDGKFVSSPAELGVWHAFPRDEQAIHIIGDGRWRQGSAPVTFAMREPFGRPLSIRRHSKHPLVGVMHSSASDAFALYTAHDGEAHFSNYHALFGRSIPAGTTATATVSLAVGDWSDARILK
jgi:sugar phosphate isomerase/epimerase